jgi:GST-like protein
MPYAPMKIEYAIDRFAMETKRQLDVLDRRCGSRYLAGDSTPSPILRCGLVRRSRQGLLYGAGEFLSVQDYKNVQRWADLVGERKAVQRGRIVNRLQGDPKNQLHERHDASDFELRTQDKLAGTC